MPRYVKEYQVTVFAATPDRRDETVLVVSVTAPLPLKLKPIAPQTVERGEVARALPWAWKTRRSGKERCAIASLPRPRRA